MNSDIITQISTYISDQSESKRSELLNIHQMIMKALPKSKLWFLDGKNSEGKVISNPNIGYGIYTIKYANGTSRDFFQIGLSGNKAGITVYLMGLTDKNYLAKNYGSKIGKASITSYCIKFNSMKDIDMDILIEAVKYCFNVTKA